MATSEPTFRVLRACLASRTLLSQRYGSSRTTYVCSVDGARKLSSLDSDRGGSRTHTHQALNLIALPVSVPGQYQVAGQGVEPSCEDYEPSPDAGPPAGKLQTPESNRDADLMRVNWAPARLQNVVTKGRVELPRPCEARPSEDRVSACSTTWPVSGKVANSLRELGLATRGAS